VGIVAFAGCMEIDVETAEPIAWLGDKKSKDKP
jgi:hypothetical protein